MLQSLLKLDFKTKDAVTSLPRAHDLLDLDLGPHRRIEVRTNRSGQQLNDIPHPWGTS
jgi:hypothetical protein